jgi:hypothetical protein
LLAVAPLYEGTTTPSPSPPRIVSIRFAQAQGRRAWIVRIEARWFVFRCPPPPAGQPANNCIASPAGELIVHVKDATGKAYSIVPTGG